MHSLHPAPAWIWQTPKPCFLAWMTLWKQELFIRQAFSCAPSSSQKLYIIVNWSTSEFSSSSEACMHLLTWWGWIMHRYGSRDFLFEMVPFQTVETKHNNDSTAILYAVLFSGTRSCAVLWWFLVQATSTTIQYHQTQICDSAEYVSD